MQIALLADIHGNMPALEAVLRELESIQPDYVLINGDLINGIPFSADVIDLVRGHHDWVVVRGNHEFYYLDFGTERAAPESEDPERWGQLHWLVEQITPAQGEYLALLPDERTLYLHNTEPVRVAHGVPGRNRVGFYNGQAVEEIVNEIQMVAETTLISAHTHVQIDRHITWDVSRQQVLQSDPHGSGAPSSPHDGYGSSYTHREIHRHWHLINPGSVGLPLNGRPTAQYALLEDVRGNDGASGWCATHRETEYDRRVALQAFHDSGMLTAGGVISELFYWEVVTAEAEIVFFYRWAWESGQDPDRSIRDAFQAYCRTTGRDQYVRQRDPLQQ